MQINSNHSHPISLSREGKGDREEIEREQNAEWSLEEVLQKTLDAMWDCETQVASEMTAVLNGNG